MFLIVHNPLLINRLIIHLSGRSLIFFGHSFFSIFDWSDNFRVINYDTLLLLNVQHLFNNFFLWLNIFFSNSSATWNSDWNVSAYDLIIYYRGVHNFLCVYGSFYFSSSNDWSLDNALFDDWLGYDFLGNYGLWNNSSLYDGLWIYFLGLGYLGSWI